MWGADSASGATVTPAAAASAPDETKPVAPIAALNSFGNSMGPVASASTALTKGAATATTYTGFACFSTQFARPLAEVDPDDALAAAEQVVVVARRQQEEEEGSRGVEGSEHQTLRADSEMEVLVLSHKRLDKLCKKSATKQLCVRLHYRWLDQGVSLGQNRSTNSNAS